MKYRKIFLIAVIVLAILAVYFIIGAIIKQKSTLRQTPEELATGENITSKTLTKVKNLREELVGIWHAGPSVAAAYDDLYVFFSDGTFRYDYSGYYEDRRLINIKGTWSLEDSFLILRVTQKNKLTGGELVPVVSGSSLSKYRLINAKLKKEQLNPPEETKYSLIRLKADNKVSPYQITIKIGVKQFWKLFDDPSNIPDPATYYEPK